MQIFTALWGIVTIAQLQAPEILPHQYRLTVTAGSVQAELSYQRTGSNLTALDRYRYVDPRMQIARLGQPRLNLALPTTSPDDQPLPSSLQIRDFDRDAEPEVIVDFRSGTGSQGCCLNSVIYGYSVTTDTYVPLPQNWGYAGYVLNDFDQNGGAEFSSADSRFFNISGFPAPPRLNNLASSSFVDAVLPLQIWQYRGGRLVDVTRSYPAALGSHAYVLWLEYWSRLNAGDATVRTDPKMKAVWAAYLADKALLGQYSSGLQVVQYAYQGRDRQAFLARTQQLLREAGYL